MPEETYAQHFDVTCNRFVNVVIEVLERLLAGVSEAGLVNGEWGNVKCISHKVRFGTYVALTCCIATGPQCSSEESHT